MAGRINIATWLAANGYADVLALIRSVEAAWAAAGKKTRRDWWLVLAGTLEGQPCVVAGVEFPILAAARRRKRWPHVPAERSNQDEAAPPRVWRGRWT